ncbi:hypothetical protein diail_2197 [Diaporthe ilicicola]|nr:hypothetical protein diail_2197 [Diaporthe ilicicola]
MNFANGELAQEDHTPANVTPQSVLPGCSRGQHRNNVRTLSGTTMQAYVAMRGPGTDLEDPLMAWIASKERDKRVKGELTMLGDIENSIKDRFDWKSRGPSVYGVEEAQRKSVFTFPRPRNEHLRLKDLEMPEDLDTSKLDHVCQGGDYSADGWSKYAASDVSDDGEGDPADGRISPCTFAQWSRGARRWDAPDDKYKSAWEERKVYDIPTDRQRPPTPTTPLPRQTKHRITQSLYDEEDGRELSPECSSYARSEPSILWSAPLMSPRLPYGYYNHVFDRMDPELMRKVRIKYTSTEPSWGVKTASEPEYYTPSEVDAATEKYWGLALTQALIANKHREVARLVRTEEQANAAADRLRHEAKRLKHENRRLADCLELHRTTRDRRIMRQVQRHIAELSYVARAKLSEIKARVREHDELQRERDTHELVQRNLLALLGKKTPEDVFAMYPNVWEPEEARKNRRNYS